LSLTLFVKEGAASSSSVSYCHWI